MLDTTTINTTMGNESQINVIWLSGNKAQRSKAFSNIRNKYGECEELHFDASCMYDVLEETILSTDCFGSRRMIILSEMPQFSGNRQTYVSRFKRVLEHIPEDCLIVFNGIDASNERAISGHVAKIGKLLDYQSSCEAEEAIDTVRQLLLSENKIIDKEQLESFVRSIYSTDGKKWDIDELTTATTKLLCFVDKRAQVTKEDIDSISFGNSFSAPWPVFDAIDNKDFDLAYRRYLKLFECQSEGNTIDFVTRFLHLAHWKFKLLCFVNECRFSGNNDLDIIKGACAIQKINKNDEADGFVADKQVYGEKIVANLINGFGATTLGKYSRKRLVAIIEFLQEAILEIRSLNEESQFSYLITLFLLVACEKIDDIRYRSLWRLFDHG